MVLTLFSIILVLSVYYIALQSEPQHKTEAKKKVIRQAIILRKVIFLATLRVEDDEEVLRVTRTSKTLLDVKASAEDKNNAYEMLLNINLNKGKKVD